MSCKIILPNTLGSNIKSCPTAINEMKGKGRAMHTVGRMCRGAAGEEAIFEQIETRASGNHKITMVRSSEDICMYMKLSRAVQREMYCLWPCTSQDLLSYSRAAHLHDILLPATPPLS